MWEPDYATVEELREYAGITDEDDTVDDAGLARNITAASRAIDDHCGPQRQFGQVETAQERFYTVRDYHYGIVASGGSSLVIVDDLMTLDDLVITVAGEAVTPTLWRPANAPVKGKPWTRVYLPGRLSMDGDAVSITAKWGWDAVPVAIKEACLLQALRLSKRKSSPFGVAGSPDMGSELRLLAKVDPDVAVMVHKYIRNGTVA
jgi:hypothetical protein